MANLVLVTDAKLIKLANSKKRLQKEGAEWYEGFYWDISQKKSAPTDEILDFQRFSTIFHSKERIRIEINTD